MAGSVLELEGLRQTRKDFEEMESKHNVLLELYGAREEQVEELREDIREMKFIYQTQVSELITQIENLSKK